MGHKFEVLQCGELRATVPINADDGGQDLTGDPLFANSEGEFGSREEG
jgi:hypothetical protein